MLINAVIYWFVRWSLLKREETVYVWKKRKNVFYWWDIQPVSTFSSRITSIPLKDVLNGQIKHYDEFCYCHVFSWLYLVVAWKHLFNHIRFFFSEHVFGLYHSHDLSPDHWNSYLRESLWSIGKNYMLRLPSSERNWLPSGAECTLTILAQRSEKRLLSDYWFY